MLIMQGVTLISYMKGNTGRALHLMEKSSKMVKRHYVIKKRNESVGGNEECVAQMENAKRITFFGAT